MSIRLLDSIEMAARNSEVRFLDISTFVPLDKDLCVVYRVSFPINNNNKDRITLCKVGENPTGDNICAWVLAGETSYQENWQEGKIVFSSSDLRRISYDCSSKYYLAYCDENGVVGESQPFQFYSNFEENLAMDPVSVSCGHYSFITVNIQRTVDKLKDQSVQLSKFLKDCTDKVNSKFVDFERKVDKLENSLM